MTGGLLGSANGRIALERIQAMAPDIAVVDISMPEVDGLQLAGEVARLGLGVRIIFQGHCDDRDSGWY